MRKILFVALAAATTLASPAAARPHGEGHEGDRHYGHESGDHERDWREHERGDHERHWREHERGNHGRHWREHFEGGHHRAYAAPNRNWRYRRLPVGYRLGPEYYAPRYVISNYGYYGLRAPGRFLRWVQYGPDLLLVDIRNGRVVEVIPGRF